MKGAITLILFLGFSLTAVAMDEVKTFDELDVDGNGYITQSEAKGQSEITKKWKDTDKNNDGKLDISEFSALETRMVPPDDMQEPEPGAAPTN